MIRCIFLPQVEVDVLDLPVPALRDDRQSGPGYFSIERHYIAKVRLEYDLPYVSESTDILSNVSDRSICIFESAWEVIPGRLLTYPVKGRLF